MRLKNERGVTLMALVVTIIILLILAGVVINLTIGKNGIIAIAQNATEKYKESVENEQIQINNLYKELASYNTSDGINVSEMTDIVRQIVQEEKLKQYPIGSIYMSETNTNPADFIGGEWESYGQGRTLVGIGEGNDGSITKVFSEGEIGGEYEHTLTVAEMPAHSHTTRVNKTSLTLGTIGTSSFYLAYNQNTFNNAVSTETGENQSHNNIQPYITVYMWKRVN